MEVELYGVLRGVVGARSCSVEVAESSVQAVLDAVVALHPEIAGALRGVAVAVDERIVGRDAAVPRGAAVALLPPVSGG